MPRSSRSSARTAACASRLPSERNAWSRRVRTCSAGRAFARGTTKGRRIAPSAGEDCAHLGGRMACMKTLETACSFVLCAFGTHASHFHALETVEWTSAHSRRDKDASPPHEAGHKTNSPVVTAPAAITELDSSRNSLTSRRASELHLFLSSAFLVCGHATMKSTARGLTPRKQERDGREMTNALGREKSSLRNVREKL